MNKDQLIEDFWKWFGVHEATYRSILDDQDTDLIDDILNKLIGIQRGLAVEFAKSNEIYEMTISADGVEDYFDIVQKIIHKSPVIQNWSFIAFRQPYKKEVVDRMKITVSGYKIDPKTIMFFPIVEDGKLYIQIFSSEMNKKNRSQLIYGFLMLLDNIIGEYDCVKKVDGYEYHNLNEAVVAEGELKPLTEMRIFLDNYYNIV